MIEHSASLLVAVHRAARRGDAAMEIPARDRDNQHQENNTVQHTDEQAIAFAVATGMSPAAIDEMCRTRFQASPTLQREYREVSGIDGYLGYMRHLAAKERRSASKNPPDDIAAGIIDGAEAAAVADARNRGLVGEQRTSFWITQWNASASLRDEFPEAGLYASYMNAVCDGRVRVFKRHR
jgi:hypothetical protein